MRNKKRYFSAQVKARLAMAAFVVVFAAALLSTSLGVIGYMGLGFAPGSTADQSSAQTLGLATGSQASLIQSIQGN